MRLVAVSQRVDLIGERKEYRDALDQNIVRFLVACGFIAVPVPNFYSSISQNPHTVQYFEAFIDKTQPHAVFLSGGNDIGINPERDNTELNLLAYAEQKKLPLLGICRGLQMMVYKAGTPLVQLRGHAGTRHKITGEIFGEVNSYHNFGISDCPAGYRVISRSEENSIEAIQHFNLPWEGWMWHPEREVNFENRDVERLRQLFNY
jgi:putative glutamine amidotransferase